VGKNLVTLSWYIFTKLTEMPLNLMQLSLLLQKVTRNIMIEISWTRIEVLCRVVSDA